MPDAKIQLEVRLDGADGAAQGVEKLHKAVEGLGGAQSKETAAAQNATTATNANTGAHDKNAGATGKATKAIQANTTAQNANAGAALAAGKAAQTAGGGLKEQASFAGNANKAMGALQNANMAFMRLMQGDVVGAVKMAGNAVKDFFSAIVANPALAAITAMVAAVGAVYKAWKDAKQAAEDFARRSKEIAEIEARGAERRAGGPKTLADLSDEELEKRKKAATRTLREKDEKSEEEAANARFMSERAKNEGFVHRSLSWMPGVDDYGARADEVVQRAKGAEDEAQAAQDALKAIEEEQARREQEKKAQTDRQRDMNVKQMHFSREQRYDQIADAAEESGKSGATAKAQAQIEDLERDKELAETEEERLELQKQIYALQRQIADETQRQADAEKKRAEAQQDWLRNKKLEKMEAGDRVKAIEGEMAALRKGPRNAETEARMRRLIDERDQAKAQADAQQKTQADWQRSRKLGQMDAPERVKALRAELAELKKGPRTAETEAKMRRLVDELDQAKAQVKAEAERAAQNISKEAPESTAETRQKEYVGGFRQFRKLGDREDRAARRAARARNQTLQEAQGAQIRSRSGLTPTYRSLSPTYKSLTPWYASKGPRGLQSEKPAEKKSPEAEATEAGNKILEEIREALK